MRRWTLGVAGGLAGVTALAIGAVVAFACIPIAMLNLSPNSVAPGQTVTASIQAISANPGSTVPPVVFHMDTLNGPVLATGTTTAFGTSATFSVPANATTGDHLVIATQAQAAGSSTWGMPARAVMHVSANGSTGSQSSGSAPVSTSNTAGLSTSSALSPGILALIGVGVAAVAVSLVGLATWGMARSPRPEKVSRR
ncbi:MAG: hypothetical protein ACREN2_05945 [Candidatus Dormibacteria bacterium]